MSTDYLISLIQRKYTLVGLEKSVVKSIFNGDLERPAILFITNTKRASGVYHGWGVNATNFFRFLNYKSAGYLPGKGDCHTVKHLKVLGCRKGVITEALKLVERRMENNI
jgi:hypothetical protein